MSGRKLSKLVIVAEEGSKKCARGVETFVKVKDTGVDYSAAAWIRAYGYISCQRNVRFTFIGKIKSGSIFKICRSNVGNLSLKTPHNQG